MICDQVVAKKIITAIRAKTPWITLEITDPKTMPTVALSDRLALAMTGACDRSR